MFLLTFPVDIVTAYIAAKASVPIGLEACVPACLPGQRWSSSPRNRHLGRDLARCLIGGNMILVDALGTLSERGAERYRRSSWVGPRHHEASR